MNHLKRNKRLLYLCNRIEVNSRIIYDRPIPLYVDYQSLSSDGEIIAFGEEYTNRLTVYTNPVIARKFRNADRCYVFIDKPEEYDKYCSTADFYVDGDPIINLGEGRLYLQRMTGEENA